MSSLFERCAHCGKESAGSLFCSDLCRFAVLPNSKRVAKTFTEQDIIPASDPSLLARDDIVKGDRLQQAAAEPPKNQPRGCDSHSSGIP